MRIAGRIGLWVVTIFGGFWHSTRILGTVAWATLPVSVIYTFLSPGISIGAHLGGLLAGLGFGWAMERRTQPIGSALDGRSSA
jgi:membrane associated rhomboid family serine protease